MSIFSLLSQINEELDLLGSSNDEDTLTTVVHLYA